jgi:hypothetical protein
MRLDEIKWIPGATYNRERMYSGLPIHPYERAMLETPSGRGVYIRRSGNRYEIRAKTQLNYSAGVWQDLDPITAQAVLFHLWNTDDEAPSEI